MKYIFMFFGTILFIIRFFFFFIWLFVVGSIACYYFYFSKGWHSVKILSHLARLWTRGEALIFGLKIKIHGNAKGHTGLIVSNHVSYMDIFLLGSVFPLRYAPKDDIRTWPILGWALGLSKPIWINRSSKHSATKVLHDFKNTIANGINLITFPEGTTSSGKTDLLPFKSTTFEAAISGGFSVYPVILKYEDDSIAWYGDGDPLLIHAWKVLSKRRINADLYILDPIVPEKNANRKDFCSLVYQEMNDCFIEILDKKPLN